MGSRQPDDAPGGVLVLNVASGLRLRPRPCQMMPLACQITSRYLRDTTLAAVSMKTGRAL